jgi:hypothetical protein
MTRFKTPYGIVHAPNTLRAIGKTVEEFIIPLHRQVDKHIGDYQYSISSTHSTNDSGRLVANCYVGNLALDPLGCAYFFQIENLGDSNATNR